MAGYSRSPPPRNQPMTWPTQRVPSSLPDNSRVVRPWGRWERQLVAARLVHVALLEIRFPRRESRRCRAPQYDVHLWGRDHRAAEPVCQRCAAEPATEPME